jgi:hypothetical protein
VGLTDVERAVYGQWISTLKWYQSWNQERWERDDRLLETRRAVTYATEEAPLMGDNLLPSVEKQIGRYWRIGNAKNQLGRESGVETVAKRLQKDYPKQGFSKSNISNVEKTVEQHFGKFPAWQRAGSGGKSEPVPFTKYKHINGRDTRVWTDDGWRAWDLIDRRLYAGSASLKHCAPSD